MSATLTTEELAAGWWAVNCCTGKYTGQMTAHCTSCHNTWTRPAGFDRHRRYGKCLDPATLLDTDKNPVFEPAGRKYPCWRFATDDKPDWAGME